MTNISKKTLAKTIGWGEEKWKKFRIKKLVLPDEERSRKAKRNRQKEKSIKKCGWHDCPFCGKELPIDMAKYEARAKEAKQRGHFVWKGMFHMNMCECGAYEISTCPACRNNTWFREGFYKHQRFGCGFEGKSHG